MRAKILFISIFFLVALTGYAQNFTIDDILSYSFPNNLHACPEGHAVAWVFNIKGVTNIWLARGPDFKARKMTDFKLDDGRHLEISGFSGEGKHLYFSKGSPFNPDHQPLASPESTLYQLEIANGEIKKIGESRRVAISAKHHKLAYTKGNTLWLLDPGKEAKKAAVVRGRLSQPTWSPDGEKLLFQSNRGEYPNRYSYIIMYDVQKKSISYLDAAVYLDARPKWSPDGRRVLFLRRLTGGHRGILTARKYPLPDPWEIRVLDMKSKRARSVWRSPDHDTFRAANAAWLGDHYLVFSSEASGWQHLYLLDLLNYKVKALTKGNFEVEAFRVCESQKQVYVTCNARDIDRRHIWRVGLKGSFTPVTSGRGNEWSPVITSDNQFMIFIGSSATGPAHVYSKSLASGRILTLAPEAASTQFPKILVPPQQVIFKSADNWTLHGQLFLPPNRFQGKRPAIMFFHGGPFRQMLLGFHYRGYYHRCYAMNQYLASRGYVVLAVNYRLGIGYGRTFRDVPDGGPRGGAEYQDLLAGAKFLRQHPRVNPAKIGLYGGSYGGLMTALGLARNSDLFAVGVDLHGVHDWNQWQAWADNRQNDDNRLVWKSSPLADIPFWRSPVLLIHGDDDRNVPFSETQWLVEKLEKQKVPFELLVFPDEVHSFLLHRNWVKAFQATAAFFDKYLVK